MKNETLKIEAEAISAYYGRIGGVDYWSRPAVFKVFGTAGNLTQRFYGWVEETCINGEWSYELHPQYELDRGSSIEAYDYIRENDPDVA